LLEIGSALQQDKVSSVHRSDVNASYQSENYGSATEDQSVVSDALTALTSSPAFAINATSPPREQPKITSWASLFKNNSSEQHITMPSQFSQSDTLQNESNGTAFQDPEKFKTLKGNFVFRSNLSIFPILP
jgi:hypothetical protein